MGKRDTFTRVLSIAGAALVWLPILAPALFSVIRYMESRRLRYDFLGPAELFPVALVGGGLLLWAALRARSRRWIIGRGLFTAILFLAGGMALASATGLASGDTEANGWQWVLVMTSIVIYTLGLWVTGLGGLLLVSDLFKRRKPVKTP